MKKILFDECFSRSIKVKEDLMGNGPHFLNYMWKKE